jgi:hypothetical protein
MEVHDEAFAGVGGRNDFGQMLRIEEGELQRPALDQRANGGTAQRGDPAQPRIGGELIELRLREHARSPTSTTCATPSRVRSAS